MTFSQKFSVVFSPQILTYFPRFSLKYIVKINWTKRNCYLIGSSSHTRKVLLYAGGYHLALSRLHLHILSCIAKNVTTGMHIHSQYTECTMLNLFSERENFSSTCQFSFYQCLLISKNAKTEEGKLVLVSLALCLGRSPSMVPKLFSMPLFLSDHWGKVLLK